MPLDIGAVISQTFAIVGSRIGSLLGLWGTYFALQLVGMVVLFGLVGGAAMSGGMSDNPLAMGAGMILAMIVFYVVYLMISFASTASLTHNASPLLAPTFGDSFGAGLRAIPALFLLMLLFIACYIGAAIVLAIVGGILSLLGDLGNVIFALGALAGATYLACRLSVVIPAIAVEGVTNPIVAVQRSWRLTANNALRILLVLLAFGVIVLVVFVALFAMMGGSMMGMAGLARGGDAQSLGAMGAGMVLFMLLFLLLFALFTIVTASFSACLHAALAGPEAVGETFR